MTTPHHDPHPWLPASEWERRLDLEPGSLVGVLPALASRGRVDGFYVPESSRTPNRTRQHVYRFGPDERRELDKYFAARRGYAEMFPNDQCGRKQREAARVAQEVV